MPDLFRLVPGTVLRSFLLSVLLALLTAPAPASGQPNLVGSPPAGTGEPLTLAAALSRALRHNPDLAAYPEEIRAREAETLQAGLRPNPALSFEVENALGSGDFSGTEAIETTLAISQAIELGDKRVRRRELAEAETALAQSEYLLAKADVLARTTDGFDAVLVAQKRLQLTQELAALGKRTLATVTERVEAGKAAATEGVRARIQWRELEVAREKAARQLEAARRTLAARMGSEAAAFGPAVGDLSLPADLPDPVALERLVESSPQLERRLAESERRRRAVALESARRFPDLELGVGARYLRESDDAALVAGISVPLPLFDRNQGAIAAARSRLAVARAEERSARVQAKAALSAAWQEMAAAHAEAEAFGEEILPAARQAVESAEYGYRAGKFGILEVLDAQRTLFEAQERHLAALAAFHFAANELNRLLGGELPPHGHSAALPASAKE